MVNPQKIYKMHKKIYVVGYFEEISFIDLQMVNKRFPSSWENDSIENYLEIFILAKTPNFFNNIISVSK